MDETKKKKGGLQTTEKKEPASLTGGNKPRPASKALGAPREAQPLNDVSSWLPRQVHDMCRPRADESRGDNQRLPT